MTFTTQGVFKRLVLATSAATILTALAGNVFATALPITNAPGSGVFNTSSGAGFVGVLSNTFCMNWGVTSISQTGINCSSPSLHADTSTADGTGLVEAAGVGQIRDITTTPTNDFMQAPGGAAVGGQTIHFDLLTINAPPVAVPACVPGFVGIACFTGAFLLTQGAGSVGIDMFTTESACTGAAYSAATGCGATGGSTTYLGHFSTSLTDGAQGALATYGCVTNCTATIANVIAWEAGAGHTINATWAGSFGPVAATPEPYSFLLLGSGLVGFAFMRRRRA